jgi:oxalate decarboxylase/phosphoglucose isomerase-like protein (cupin superfamily)
MRPIYLGADQGEVIDSPIGGQLVFKARGAQANGALTVFESVIPPGEGPPLHVHDGADEVIYVLEGMIRVRSSQGGGGGCVRVHSAGCAAHVAEQRRDARTIPRHP